MNSVANHVLWRKMLVIHKSEDIVHERFVCKHHVFNLVWEFLGDFRSHF